MSVEKCLEDIKIAWWEKSLVVQVREPETHIARKGWTFESCLLTFTMLLYCDT